MADQENTNIADIAKAAPDLSKTERRDASQGQVVTRDGDLVTLDDK